MTGLRSSNIRSKKTILGILATVSVYALIQDGPLCLSKNPSEASAHMSLKPSLDQQVCADLVFSTPLVFFPRMAQRCLEGFFALFFGLMWIGPWAWGLLLVCFLIYGLKGFLQKKMGLTFSWKAMGVGFIGMGALLLGLWFLPLKLCAWIVSAVLCLLMGATVMAYKRGRSDLRQTLSKAVILTLLLGALWMPITWIGIGFFWALTIGIGFRFWTYSERQKTKNGVCHGFLTSLKV